MKDNGTHVPLVAFWKGHTPQGLVSNDLIDFTDFYATFAQTAGVSLGDGDPTDGRSFLPQLNGQPGTPRDWVLCHYEPYWNKQPGQFVRTGDFKLYRDGRLFNVPGDLDEAKNLADSTDEHVQTVRQSLESLIKTLPPAPKGPKANKNTKDRPVYPDWKIGS
jgi:arylsulfatase A-like enzyme